MTKFMFQSHSITRLCMIKSINHIKEKTIRQHFSFGYGKSLCVIIMKALLQYKQQNFSLGKEVTDEQEDTNITQTTYWKKRSRNQQTTGLDVIR